MQRDIKDKMAKDFGADLEAARQLVDVCVPGSAGSLDGRLLRAVLFLANGDLTKLEEAVAGCLLDWRDVLFVAEYEDRGGEPVRVRDFNKSLDETRAEPD